MCQDVALSTKDFSLRPGDDAGRKKTEQIADYLIARIGSERFETWFVSRNCFRDTSTESFNQIAVVAEFNFSLKRLQSTFGREIREAVDRICGPHYQVQYRCEAEVGNSNELICEDAGVSQPANFENEPDQSDWFDESSSFSEEPQLHQATLFPLDRPQPKQNQPASKKRRNKTRSSFWFGVDNRLAEASVDQVFQRPGEFSPLLIHGPTGCGKSHLLEATVNDYRRKLKFRSCVYMSAEQFTSLFVASLRGGAGLPVFRRKYRDLDLLAIDDIQFLAGKSATLAEFQYTIDNLIRLGKQIVVTSDRPPLELGILGGELSGRLTAGLHCPLRYPDMEGRMKIAQKFCREREMDLPRSVLELVCDRITRDVRRLSGALNRLHALGVSLNARITPEIAQKELCDMLSSHGARTTMLSVEQVVCELCGVKPADLRSKSRRKQVSTARMLAMYLAREHTTSALSEIGDYFGGRSHSTVIAAKRKVKGWIKSNEGVSLAHATYPAKEVINRIESNLRIG